MKDWKTEKLFPHLQLAPCPRVCRMQQSHRSVLEVTMAPQGSSVSNSSQTKGWKGGEHVVGSRQTVFCQGPKYKYLQATIWPKDQMMRLYKCKFWKIVKSWGRSCQLWKRVPVQLAAPFSSYPPDWMTAIHSEDPSATVVAFTKPLLWI